MKSLSSLFLLPFLIGAAVTTEALGTDCPEGVKSCKVITLTPDEEQVLIAPRMILDTAAVARQLDLANLVAYFRSKIDKAEAGTVKAAPAEDKGNPALGAGPKTPAAEAPK